MKVLEILDEPTRRRALRFAVYTGVASALIALMLVVVSWAVDLSPTTPSYYVALGALITAVGASYWLHKSGGAGLMAELERALSSLRVRVTTQIVSADLRAVEQARDVGAVYTRDIEQVSFFFGQSFAFLQMVLIAIPGVLFIVLKSLYGAMALGVMSALVAPRYVAEFKKSRESSEQVSRKASSFHTLLGQTLEGFKQIKIDERVGQAVAEDLEARYRSLKKERLRLEETTRNTVVGSSGILFLAMALILFVIPANTAVDASTLYELALMLNLLIGPVIFFASQVYVLIGANVAYQNLEDLGQRLREEPAAEAPSAGDKAVAFQRITVENATFTYDRTDKPGFTVGPVDLVLERGQLVFITGGNGSGKTTLMKLLCGLYAPQRGRVLVDGEVVEPHNLERYRALFTAIFSDQYLFRKPYGVTIADPARVDALLQRFGLKGVTRLEDGRFTNLDLSTGQAKRLAMVIALLEDRPIFLLDEWAAHQDPELRRFYYTELLQELKAQGKMVLAVSHDDRYFDLADHRITLGDGQIRFDSTAPGAGPSTMITRP